MYESSWKGKGNLLIYSGELLKVKSLRKVSSLKAIAIVFSPYVVQLKVAWLKGVQLKVAWLKVVRLEVGLEVGLEVEWSEVGSWVGGDLAFEDDMRIVTFDTRYAGHNFFA